MAAIVIVAVLLFAGGSGYTVKADFLNGGQLVNGNRVEVSGVGVGSVEDINLTSDGQAEVTLSVAKPYAPLRRGTIAVIRQASLSGIANRYVDLEMPPGDERSTPTIPAGGLIDAAHTKTAIDLDQLFNTIDPTTRKAIQEFFQNSAVQFQGKTDEQRLAYYYLNPALSTGSRLFSELNRDQPLLARFLIDSSALVNALATKRDDLAALIGNLNVTFHALGSQKAALAEAVARLPGFMRQANSTFVDLRSTLDDLDPLVNASKPVAPKLNALLTQLEPFAHDAVPTVRDLARIVHQPGPDNDLFDLQQGLPPLEQIAVETRNRTVNEGQGPISVGNVRGALPETAQALTGSAPIVAEGRPYTPELIGWFDDFSTSGSEDAAGGFSRSFNIFNAFDAAGNYLVLANRQANLNQNTRTGQYARCPGAAEAATPDNSNVLSAQEQQALDCTESARATGTVTTPGGNP